MSGNKKFPRTHAGRLAADMVLRYYTHDVARDSAALTYYLLFAIFPLLIFISTLLGLLELDVAYITSVLEPLLPADVVDVVRSYLEYVSANQSRQLLWFSLIFSIWFPMRASGCLMHSLRKAFGRSWCWWWWDGPCWSLSDGSSPSPTRSSPRGAPCASCCWRWLWLSRW